MATIYDVAQKAGVSPATVSRVLNNRWGVNEKTALKVEQAIEQTDFKPRWNATRTNAVGIVVAPSKEWLRSPYQAALLSGMTNTLFEGGYAVELINAAESDNNLSNIRRLMSSHKIQGVIVITTYRSYNVSNQIGSVKIPHVVVGPLPEDERVQRICVDDDSAGYKAMKHLWDLGHRRIGIISGKLDDAGHMQRVEGAMRCFAEQGGDPAHLYNREALHLLVLGSDPICAELLKPPVPVTAMIITNSSQAQGVVKLCRRNCIGIPEDLSIISFEDDGELEKIDPELTVMQQPSNAMGVCAAQLIVAQIEGHKVPPMNSLDLQLVVRESTQGCGPSA